MPKNAVDEFLALKKTANPWSNFGQNLSHAAAGGLAAGAVGATMAGVGMAANHILDAATKQQDFRAMLEANPDLQAHHTANPKHFGMMFSTLRTMNPQFSKDPLVAGAFMRQMQENPIGVAGIAGEALKHRQDFERPVSEAFSSFGREGAKAGLTEGLKQRTPEELLAQQKPLLDYQHAQREGSQLTGRLVDQHFETQMQGRKEQFEKKKMVDQHRMKGRENLRGHRQRMAESAAKHIYRGGSSSPDE